MIAASIYYLGVTVLFFAIFATIVVRVYQPDKKERLERAKYRMMDDEEISTQTASSKEDGDAGSR